MKLHLGCGLRYLDGYINIDYQPTDHTVQSEIRADKYADIVQLSYMDCSVDEIRLHHVFEHFSRPVALALLCRWRDWLKPGGLLRIETPDAMACFNLMTSPFITFDKKQQVMRHLFGSHEAFWAVHWDGWHKKKFAVTLKMLGFDKLNFVKNKWGALRNLEVFAIKTDAEFGLIDYSRAAKELLKMSTVRVGGKRKSPEGSELAMLEVWMHKWHEIYGLDKGLHEVAIASQE